MTLRRRDIGTVVPRRADTFGAAAVEPVGAAVVVGDCETVPAASTSCLRMRPPTPEPDTFDRSMPRSLASLRTIGVTYRARSPGAAGAGAAAAGAGSGAAA